MPPRQVDRRWPPNNDRRKITANNTAAIEKRNARNTTVEASVSASFTSVNVAPHTIVTPISASSARRDREATLGHYCTMAFMRSRRDLLVTIGALPILAQEAPKKSRTFSPSEMTLIRDLADTILPRTDTPGAADVGVEWHIDAAMAGKKKELAGFRKGLAAAARQQKRGINLTSILTALQAQKDPFFRQLKDLTIDGYYTSKEGLTQELGWHGLTPMADFEGCTHPEHQLAKIG